MKYFLEKDGKHIPGRYLFIVLATLVFTSASWINASLLQAFELTIIVLVLGSLIYWSSLFAKRFDLHLEITNLLPAMILIAFTSLVWGSAMLLVASLVGIQLTYQLGALVLMAIIYGLSTLHITST